MLENEKKQIKEQLAMNKELLTEETNSDLKAICKQLLVDIDNTIDIFR